MEKIKKISVSTFLNFYLFIGVTIAGSEGGYVDRIPCIFYHSFIQWGLGKEEWRLNENKEINGN